MLLISAVVAGGAAHAEPNALVTNPPRASAELAYAGYVAGLNVSNIRAAFQFGPQGYEMGVAFRTAGLIGTFFKAENIARVEGAWRGTLAAPRAYASAGVWRGSPRQIEIDYPAGQPLIKTFLPATDPEHEPVPQSMRQNTMDALSAVASLVHTVASTGRCEGETTTFDGRRVSKISVRTIGMENLPVESRSSFAGQALRCDVDGRQIAGFATDAGPDDMVRKPQHSTVWLAVVQPDMPAVPVMISLEVRFMGHMTVYLTQAKPGAQLAQYTPHLPQ